MIDELHELIVDERWRGAYESGAWFAELKTALYALERLVCVVLSSSSVPRVGKRAAVRRLHRADLVREMAGMLG